MKLNSNSYGFIFLMIVMVFIIAWSLGMKSIESKLLPLIVSGVILILAAFGLRNELGKQKITAATDKTEKQKQSRPQMHKYLRNLAWVFGFGVSIYLIGFLAAMTFFIFAYMKWLGTSWRMAIIFTIVTPVIMYFGFYKGLNTDLYPGLLLLALTH